MRGSCTVTFFAILLAGMSNAFATTCHLYLANQSGNSTGFALSLKSDVNGCPLNSVSLELAVGTQRVSVSSNWQYDQTYTVEARLYPAGRTQELYLNGQLAGQLSAGFQPASGPLSGSDDVLDPMNAEYVIGQMSLSLSNGPSRFPKRLMIAPNGTTPLPMDLIVLSGGPALWQTSFTEVPLFPTSVQATFQFHKKVTDQTTFQPYIDRYGQAIKASWPGKVMTADDLTATVSAEQSWIGKNPAPTGFDVYGGSKNAGWQDKTSAYYHTAFHGNRWWLVSPEGNPVFYLGVTSVAPYSTPISGRPKYFDSLPAETGVFAPAYSQPDNKAVTAFSFVVANELRKYCTNGDGTCGLPAPGTCQVAKCALADVTDALESRRFASWGFTGEGKYFGQARLAFPSVRPAFPVLDHEAAKLPSNIPGVADVVPNGHPDPWDPTTLTQLSNCLHAQIAGHISDPFIVGWSVGNEKDEIIGTDEIKAVLAAPANVPAKQALMTYAVNSIYRQDWKSLDSNWGVSATTLPQLFASTPSGIPGGDVDKLRAYYENQYYAALRSTLKSIDVNHLYLGSWILTGDPTLAADWPIAAANSDVVGFDGFEPGPLSSDLVQLFASTNKPVLMGAWGAPSDYAGTRGFGWNQYTMTLSDSAAGDAYATKLLSAAADSHMVGAMVFDYYDEPLTGRGGTGSAGDGSSLLVIGESFAFGLLDTTDTPKYDLVDKVRAANLLTLFVLGLARP